MKEPYSEDLASHAGPESRICTGNGIYEALTGVHVGQVLNRGVREIFTHGTEGERRVTGASTRMYTFSLRYFYKSSFPIR